MWCNIRIDGETGDPLAIGKVQSACLGVVDDLVIALVGPVLKSPAALIFVAGLAKNTETVRGNHSRLITRAACCLGILRGPGTGHGVIKVSVSRCVTDVRHTETPRAHALTEGIRVVVTGLGDSTARLAQGETMGDFRALRQGR